MSRLFERERRFLFLGDSITDGGRNRENGAHLGSGYVYLLAAELQTRRPDIYYAIINRGIGGDAVHNLLRRVDRDCMALRPEVLTIQCGLNDATYRPWPEENGIPLTPEEFEADYRALLERVRDALPHTRVMLMTPFLHVIAPEHHLNHRLVVQYGQRIARLADQYDCLLVRLGEAFDEAFAQGLGTLYTLDGAHPTPAGARFIAQRWLKVAESGGIIEA